MEKLSGEGTGTTEEVLRGHLKAVHRNTIGKLLSLRDIQDFAEKSIDILHYLFNHSTARLHPVFFPFSEAFIQALHNISTSLLKDTRFTDTRSYFTLFRKYLASCYTPFDGTPVKGLQVLGVLETRNLSFDRVFILDMNEEVIPDTRKEETLLPFRVRESLGLPTYLDRDKLSAYFFETLWRGAREVHLFSIENDEKERSRFVEKLLWEKQKKDRLTASEPYFRSVQYRLNLGNSVPGEIEKSAEVVKLLKDSIFSATGLDTYLRCPLQFYYQYVLRIDRREEMTETIERADIGRFVHLVLSRFFGKRKGSPLRERDVNAEEMGLLMDTLFEEEYGKNPVGAAYLLKGQIKAHLADYIQRYVIPLIEDHPVTVLHVEQSITIEKNAFMLKGRLDQVEERGEKTFIIDYKTSSHPDYLRIRFEKLDPSRRETWSDAIGSLQLPFYLLLYSESSKKKVPELDALFLLLGRMFINREMELAWAEDDENRREKFELMERVIFSLLKEIVDPAVPFRPPPSRKALCPTCDFKYVCGTQWIS
jgi:CRISPR/Cas system-associated exonuclease Cas4 (RecB family)